MSHFSSRRCKGFMDVEMPYIAPPDPHHLLEEEKPHCETSMDIIDVKLNVNERACDLQYRMTDVSVTKGLKLLQVSFECNTVLNALFLGSIVGA
ncbi:hypothetical protein TorRG33x02_310560 [Trema orientale]|uniref:Uncharacterized protein n=1 Tax=Trema orientale TaxID=63057 RepID=A0A2P5BSK0_TREOI|nr:hypothetical protein TorRG33x02_310560 [Trema orientale]